MILLPTGCRPAYIPKGGLGDVKKAVSEKLGLYNQHTAGKPQSYGAYAKTYTFLKYNSSQKMVPENNSVYIGEYMLTRTGRLACQGYLHPHPILFYYAHAETEVDDEKIKKLLDLTNNTNIKPYISFWVKNMGFGGGTKM